MNKSIRTCGLLVALAIAFSAAAFAQYDDQPGSKFSAFVGLYSPPTGALREGGSLWKSFGVGYSLQSDAAGRPTLYLSADYKGAQKNSFTGSCISLTAMKLFHSNPESEEATSGLYYGAGVSANLLDEKIDAQPFQIPPIDADNASGTAFGITAVGGYDFGSSFYAELRYSLMSKLTSDLGEDVDFGGLAVFVGTRSLF